MRTIFTASNGLPIKTGTNGALVAEEAQAIHGFASAPLGRHALAEYFEQERDQELERWRSTNHPTYVVYQAHHDQAIRVLNETDGTHRIYHYRVDNPNQVDTFAKVAYEYYAAHPEPDPWYDAEPGEVWLLDITEEGDSVPALVHRSNAFETVRTIYPFTHPAITDGRRIWPATPGAEDD